MNEPIPVDVRDLLGVSEQQYGTLYRAHVLEQYKLYVQMADEISKRRNTANAFFLSINTGTVAFLGLIRVGQNINPAWYAVVGLAGVTLSIAWQRTIQSYGNLNTAKFTVVHEIEKLLPLRPFDAEWSLVKRGADDSLYLPVSRLEGRVPWVFLCLYVALIALIFIS